MRKNRPLSILIQFVSILLILFTLHFVAFKHYESTTWNESFWQTWQTFTTVGYGNQPAETTEGRMSSVLFATFGIAILGAVFSAVFDLKGHYQDIRRLGKMVNKQKNGYVIVNFPGEGRTLKIINELRATEPNVPICIIDEVLEELPNNITIQNEISFINGEILNLDTYKRANIVKNKVIVFPKEQSGESNADAMTKVVVDVVLKACANTKVMYLVNDIANEWMFDKRAVAVARGLWLLALVQECQGEKNALLIERILTNNNGVSPATEPAGKLAFMNWMDFRTKLAELNEKIILLGKINNEGFVDLFPGDASCIMSDDLISMIVPNDLKWSKIEAKILKGRIT